MNSILMPMSICTQKEFLIESKLNGFYNHTFPEYLISTLPHPRRMYRHTHRPRKQKIAPKQPLLLSPVVTIITPPCYPPRIHGSTTNKPLNCSDRILTCRIKSIRSPAKVGLVVTDLITSPVVSWEGWETPPPQHRGSAVISLLNHRRGKTSLLLW